jgi:hypothetical protein
MVRMTVWGFLLLPAVFLFVALLNDAVSFLGYIVLNGEMAVSDELEMIWKKWSQCDLSTSVTFAWRDWENNKKLRVAGIIVKIWTVCLIPLQLSPTYVYQSQEHISAKDYYSSSSCEQNGHVTKGSINILLEGGNVTAQEICGCVNHRTLSAASEYSVFTRKWQWLLYVPPLEILKNAFFPWNVFHLILKISGSYFPKYY